MNLYQEMYNVMRNHKRFWNYYDMDFDDVFQNEDIPRDFIYNYFKSGSKTYELDNVIESMNECKMRNVHTVNVFFIGVILQRIIDKNIAIKSSEYSDYPFSYIWYLLCLAHDWGYMYEMRSEEYIAGKQIKLQPIKFNHDYITAKRRLCNNQQHSWCQRHGVNVAELHYISRDGSIQSNKNIGQEDDHKIIFNNGSIVKRSQYSAITKYNYFCYRVKEMNTLDHGIVGADYFYSKMIINYIKEYRKVAKKNNFQESIYDFHNDRYLHFCSEQIKIFAYIADCIASHNIYMAEDKDKEIYRKYYLNSLLPERFKRISYKDNPLLFILCVADTIEPSKRFQDYSNDEILRLITVEYNLADNELRIGIDEELCNSVAGRKYVSSVESLPEWCDINVKLI